MKLATGSQTESHDEKSSAGHEEQYSEDDDYEQVAVCCTYTVLIHVHSCSAQLLLLLYSVV